MSVYALGLLISIAVYLAVGNYAGRRVKQLDDYFVAGRNAPTLLIVGTLVASLMSTNAFMGESGMGYGGYPAIVIILTAVNCAGYILGGLYFGRFLRRSRSLTLAEYFGRRFGSRRVQAAAGLTIVVGCTAYLVMVTQGAATIIGEVSGIPFHWALLLAWGGYTLFTLYSGSQGVVITDTIMFLLFAFVAFLGLGFIVHEAGGWFTSVAELAVFETKPGIISWHGMNGPDAIWQTPADSLAYALILGLAWGIVVAVSPWQASRYLMARNEHVVIRSATITAGIVMLLYLVLMYTGAVMNLIEPGIEPAQENLVWAAMNVLPTAVGVLMMSGILAAGLSSASTFLSLVGFSASNDIAPPSGSTEKARLKRSRVAMLFASLAALVIAFLLPQGKLFWITYFAGTLFASSWGPVAFMSVWSRRITEGAAFWGILVGLAGNVGMHAFNLLGGIDLPAILDPILVGAVLSWITVVTVSAAGEVSPSEHAWREKLHETPAAEIDFVRLRKTLFWSWVLIGGGVVTAALMVVFYYLPYRQAVGGAAVGELMMSLGVGLALIVTGVLARKGTLASYDPGRMEKRS
jgi:sodium/pantothenate symporter